MMWKTNKLGNLVRRKIGYGVVQPGASLPSGVPIIKVNNIIAGLTNVDALDKTSKEIECQYQRTRLHGGELVISLVGSVGNTAIVPPSHKGCNLVRATGLIDIEDPMLTKWVKYYIDSPKGQNYIKENLNTTVQATLNIKSLVEMPIPLPNPRTLDKIVSVLSSLDDKIENNNRINVNLEAQAQALFKSWFIDFEPFGGVMPEDWSEGTISELVDLLNGFAFKSSDFVANGIYKLITIKGVQDGKMSADGADCLDIIPAKMPQWCLLQKGDILLSLTGNVGRCCLVDMDHCLLNQRVAKLQPKTEYTRLFVYTLFRQEEMKSRMISIARGTAQMNLSPIETGKLSTIVPSEEILANFGKRYNGILDTILNNISENQRLATLRDTLLPKLMKGEIEL